MNLQEIKTKAKAQLQDGKSAEYLSDVFGVPVAVVRQWERELTTKELEGRELANLADNKAIELIQGSAGEFDEEQLRRKLLTIADRLAGNILGGVYDNETARNVNISANTIATLYKTIFQEKASTNITVNNDSRSIQMDNFRKLLKD